LVGVDVVIVELLEDRQIFGGLLGVVHFRVPFLCGSGFAGGGDVVLVRFLVLLTAPNGAPFLVSTTRKAQLGRPALVVTIPPASASTETAVRRGELSSPQPPIHPG
jgi:hypothetical protein